MIIQKLNVKRAQEMSKIFGPSEQVLLLNHENSFPSCTDKNYEYLLQ